MAEEETRRLLRTFGVTVTNFEERSARIRARARQLHQVGDSEAMLTLLNEFAGEILDLQGRWLEITNHILTEQRQVLTDIATIVSDWGQQLR
jgi:hypothetical protein